MSSTTIMLTKLRGFALWACALVSAILILALILNMPWSPKPNPTAHLKWARIVEATGYYLFQFQNPVGVFLMLSSVAGILHLTKKELRLPGIILSTLSLTALFLALFGGINSDF